jgi:quinate dehydrogenase (quinone)
MRGLGVLAILGTMAFFGLAFVPHGVFSPGPNSPYTPAAANTTPSDWYAYGRTTAGTRYAAFTQISRDNVKDLKLAWTKRRARRLRWRRVPPIRIPPLANGRFPDDLRGPSRILR